MISNHPGNANVVVDSLSRKNVIDAKDQTQKVCIEGKWTIKHKPIRSILENVSIQSKLVEDKLASPKKSEELPGLIELANKEKSGINIGVDGGLRYVNQIWIPKDSELRVQILKEAHQIKYTLHSGTTKMYKDH